MTTKYILSKYAFVLHLKINFDYKIFLNQLLFQIEIKLQDMITIFEMKSNRKKLLLRIFN